MSILPYTSMGILTNIQKEIQILKKLLIISTKIYLEPSKLE